MKLICAFWRTRRWSVGGGVGLGLGELGDLLEDEAPGGLLRRGCSGIGSGTGSLPGMAAFAESVGVSSPAASMAPTARTAP